LAIENGRSLRVLHAPPTEAIPVPWHAARGFTRIGDRAHGGCTTDWAGRLERCMKCGAARRRELVCRRDPTADEAPGMRHARECSLMRADTKTGTLERVPVERAETAERARPWWPASRRDCRRRTAC
jgi:hypothetical protein